jgi:signal transduction histidine kinase
VRPRLLVALTAAAAAVATLLVVVLPFVRFAYRSQSTHVALETAAALIAFLAAYLVFGRYRLSGLASDLALVAALALLAGNNLLFLVLPAVLDKTGSSSAWAPVAGGLLGAAALAASALAPPRRLRAPDRAAAWTLAACAASLAAIGLVVLALGDRLPAGIDPALAPVARPHFAGHWAVLAAQLAGAALFGAAALGFALRAERTGDELMRWFAAGATLAAAGRVNYFLFPSLYSEWVYTGDVFRLGFYLLLLAGAGLEIRAYWHRLAEAAALEERRRVARELHDGVIQELALIEVQARELSRQEGSATAAGLAKAAERALDESRRAVSALTRASDEPLRVALAKAAEEVAAQHGAQVKLSLASVQDVTPETYEALVRIVREAIRNAVRHGGATTVEVELVDGPGLQLRVTDDGRGFDTEAPRAGGFGLVSMRDRARSLGGELRVSSHPGAGCKLEVILP